MRPFEKRSTATLPGAADFFCKFKSAKCFWIDKVINAEMRLVAELRVVGVGLIAFELSSFWDT